MFMALTLGAIAQAGASRFLTGLVTFLVSHDGISAVTSANCSR